jgi:hypothetical protein
MKRAAVSLLFIGGCGPDGEGLWIVAAVCVGFLAIHYVLEFVESFSAPERMMRRARRVSIAEAPEGEVVRIDGWVLPGETVEVPLTGRRCVYYSVTVEIDDGGEWCNLARETGGVAFTIDDGTGCAIVDPEGARIIKWGSTERRLGSDSTPREAAFLARHGIKPLGKTLYYQECVFEIGGPIAVMCQPIRELAPDVASRSAVYRAEPRVHLRLGGSSTPPIRRIRPGKDAWTDTPVLLSDAGK